MKNTVPTYRVQIHMAGDIQQAKQVCREFCVAGLCVTISPQDFIYTGGEEAGFVVGLINYPKFPSAPESLYDRAVALADLLRSRLFQDSYSIVADDITTWDSHRGR